MMHVVGLFDRALGFGVAAETAGFGMFSQEAPRYHQYLSLNMNILIYTVYMYMFHHYSVLF